MLSFDNSVNGIDRTVARTSCASDTLVVYLIVYQRLARLGRARMVVDVVFILISEVAEGL